MNDIVHTQPTQQPVFFHPVDQMKRRIILAEKFSRMGVESDYGRRQPLRLCSLDCRADHLLVPLMNTIKIANCGTNRAMTQRRIAN